MLEAINEIPGIPVGMLQLMKEIGLLRIEAVVTKGVPKGKQDKKIILDRIFLSHTELDIYFEKYEQIDKTLANPNHADERIGLFNALRIAIVYANTPSLTMDEIDFFRDLMEVPEMTEGLALALISAGFKKTEDLRVQKFEQIYDVVFKKMTVYPEEIENIQIAINNAVITADLLMFEMKQRKKGKTGAKYDWRGATEALCIGGGPYVYKGGPYVYKGGPYVYKGGPYVYKGGPYVYKGGPYVYKGGPYVYKGGPYVYKGGPYVYKGGPSVQEVQSGDVPHD